MLMNFIIKLDLLLIFSSVKLQVEEITNIMKENVNKLFARGDRLEDLDARSENLRSASSDFHAASSRFLHIKNTFI